ncbi:MAG: 2-C-methyl-D-erythritol 4-phosphate cytidylyltransferase [Betaproteobacteria bacterium]
MSCYALIPAAGNGFRFGAGMPKQYSLLCGKPVLQHAIERLTSALAPAMTYVVLAQGDQWFDGAMPVRKDVTVLRCGGATRATSIHNALDALSGVAAEDDWIVVHDAVRPCLDRASVLRLQTELADDVVGGLLAVPVTSPLQRSDAHARVASFEPREGLWRAQTPQMFRYRMLQEAFARPGSEHATDEAHAVEALGMKPRLVLGSTTNIKVTYPEDLLLAAAILAAQPGCGETSRTAT